MNKLVKEIINEIEELPYGDYEIDHSKLDELTLKTLKLFPDLEYSDIDLLSDTLSRKWNQIKSMFHYA